MTLEDIQAGQVLLVDKPLDWTSFQAVNRIKFKIKKEFNIKKIKIGHAGTLDPRATGLLVVCTGKATKSIPTIQDAPKEYYAEIKLGVQTPSYDTETEEILPRDISMVTEEQVKKVLEQFLGEVDQTPPIFSAIKIEGERAYNLARAGQEVKMKARKTTIFYIKDIDIEFPYVRFLVGCSKGTYIRSLAHDIGQALNVGAYLTGLRRTQIGNYHIDQAIVDYLDSDFKFSTNES